MKLSERLFRRSFGMRLKAARGREGMTQRELATDAGVDVSYVSLIENGRKLPSLDVLKRLCVAVDATPNGLMGWDR